MFVQRDLFGGAITTESAPDLVDASDIRQIPDSQEVFMYPGSSISIIVEVLQRVDVSDSDHAVRFHFGSLAHDNSARHSEVISVVSEPDNGNNGTPVPIVLRGLQHVPKFNQSTPDKVRIFMALFRVEQKSIDLVVTFNVPVDSVDGGAVSSTGLGRAEADFTAFVRSLRIVDYGLFA